MTDALAKTFLLTLERRFAAPPETVFRYLTEPALIRQWWGPDGVTCGDVAVDLRVGGAWKVDCLSPEGELYPFGGVYRQIDRPGRLVKTWVLPKSRAETTVTLDLVPDGTGTRLGLNHDGFPESDFRDRHSEGWDEGFDHLAALLA